MSKPRIVFELSEEEHREIKIAAALRGESISDISRRLLRDWVKSVKKGKASK